MALLTEPVSVLRLAVGLVLVPAQGRKDNSCGVLSKGPCWEAAHRCCGAFQTQYLACTTPDRTVVSCQRPVGAANSEVSRCLRAAGVSCWDIVTAHTHEAKHPQEHVPVWRGILVEVLGQVCLADAKARLLLVSCNEVQGQFRRSIRCTQCLSVVLDGVEGIDRENGALLLEGFEPLEVVWTAATAERRQSVREVRYIFHAEPFPAGARARVYQTLYCVFTEQSFQYTTRSLAFHPSTCHDFTFLAASFLGLSLGSADGASSLYLSGFLRSRALLGFTHYIRESEEQQS